MTKPGKSQQPAAGKGASNPAEPGSAQGDGQDLERHGIPPEMVRAEAGPDDTEPKGRPTSDRENMEATAVKQKAGPRK